MPFFRMPIWKAAIPALMIGKQRDNELQLDNDVLNLKLYDIKASDILE